MFRRDYLVVGAGLYGSTFARIAAEAGKSVLVVEKNNYIGGQAHTKINEGIHVHVFGPHYFHTNNKKVWDWVNQFGEFNSYQARIKATKDGRVYSLPFNMMTYYQLWGCVTPAEAKQKIKEQIVKIDNPSNLEEYALSKVGKDIYHTLIYGYTKKQWQKEPKSLPSSILGRLPIRFTYDDNYHNAKYYGIPINGYTNLIENILDHPKIKIKLNCDFNTFRNWKMTAKRLVYSGPIDQLFNYDLGVLEYRSLEFKSMTANGDYQGIGQMNHTGLDTPYTRIIEHKHFCQETVNNKKSIVSFEYPKTWEKGMQAYYPINDKKNNELFSRYKLKLKNHKNIICGGRLGNYAYMDMDMVIASAMNKANEELK